MNKDRETFLIFILNFFSIILVSIWLPVCFWIALYKADELPWASKSFVLETLEGWNII